MRNQALDLLNQVIAEMEIYHDQRSETWQESERVEQFNELMESISDTAEALMKMLYLVTQDVVRKWTMRVPHWGQILHQLSVFFPDRVNTQLS
jgi:transposase-like protein